MKLAFFTRGGDTSSAEVGGLEGYPKGVQYPQSLPFQKTEFNCAISARSRPLAPTDSILKRLLNQSVDTIWTRLDTLQGSFGHTLGFFAFIKIKPKGFCKCLI